MSRAIAFSLVSILLICSKQAMAYENENSGLETRSYVAEESGLAGKVCMEYKYTSESNKQQSLGRLDPNNPSTYAYKSNAYVRSANNDVKSHSPKKNRKVAKNNNTVDQTKRRPTEYAASQPETGNVPQNAQQQAAVLNEPTITVTKTQEISNNESPFKNIESDAGVASQVTVQNEALKPTQPITQEASTPSEQPNVQKQEVASSKEAEKIELPTVDVSNESVQQDQAPKNLNNSMAAKETLKFDAKETDISNNHEAMLAQVADQLKIDPTKYVKVYSYSFSPDGNSREARRISLQRAIKVRKSLIDKDIQPNRITVKSIDDSNSRFNMVELELSNSSS